MNQLFTCYMPTRIIFGAGTLKELATTPHLPGKKALVVISAGKSMRANGYLQRTLDSLKANGVESVIYDKILPNPISEHVDEGAAVARAHGCDFIVGLGGGSTIDASKSIAVMVNNPGTYWDYVSGGSGKGQPVREPVLPLVAIPTTAGTGTESDPWTVITKTDTNEKIGWGIDRTFPVLAIVDPELMRTVPAQVTAFTGMDAFFHAAEGYIANVHQPVSDLYALDSIRLIAQWLPVAVRDGANMEARTALAWASTQAGMVESTSSCTSHHSLEHALSAYHPELPHGAGLVLLSVAYFTHMAQRACPERFANMAGAMGEDVDRLAPAERPMAFITALRKLIGAIDLGDLSLADYGVETSEAATLARNARHTMGGLFTVDPAPLNEGEVVKIYEECIAGGA